MKVEINFPDQQMSTALATHILLETIRHLNEGVNPVILNSYVRVAGTYGHTEFKIDNGCSVKISRP